MSIFPASTHFATGWFSDVLLPPFPYTARFMKATEPSARQEKWSELPKPYLDLSASMSLSCLGAELLCCVPRLLVGSGEGDSLLPAADIRGPLPPYFSSYGERSLSMKSTVFSMYISWLKLVSGTVNKTVPTSARQAIAWTAKKDFCKTNAYICTKSLCWSASAIGSAFKQCVCTLTREQTLFIESHAQMYKAEHG